MAKLEYFAPTVIESVLMSERPNLFFNTEKEHIEK